MGDYETLLKATVDHLRNLQAQGVQYVRVERAVLKEFSEPAPRARAVSPRAVPPAGLAAPAVQREQAPASSRGVHLVPARPALSLEEREAAMADLRARALACVQCPNLVASRKNIVFGVGNIHTELMFVGEAPGADEDEQGEPFVGAAGQLLTRIIQTMGYTRESVYIANVLKCRPDTPGQLHGNRKPRPEEMQTCLPYLMAQIHVIRPKVIVALGGTAVEGLFGKPVGIMKLRGQWQQFREIPVMPTYHPAYLLRNQALAEKRKVWEDMLQVLTHLGRPISDKQRAYFSKPG